MAKADIDFEKELWDAANELRGAVSENNYKNYILPLVFVKHLSERYEVVREELKEQLNPKSDYYTTDKEEINYVLEDRDEYRSRNTKKKTNLKTILRTKNNRAPIKIIEKWAQVKMAERLHWTKEEITPSSLRYMHW